MSCFHSLLHCFSSSRAQKCLLRILQAILPHLSWFIRCNSAGFPSYGCCPCLLLLLKEEISVLWLWERYFRNLPGRLWSPWQPGGLQGPFAPRSNFHLSVSTMPLPHISQQAWWEARSLSRIIICTEGQCTLSLSLSGIVIHQVEAQVVQLTGGSRGSSNQAVHLSLWVQSCHYKKPFSFVLGLDWGTTASSVWARCDGLK